MLILLGIEEADTHEDVDWLCAKLSKLRIFDDGHDSMNFDINQVGGSFLVVSQFTLYADLKSRRPGFSHAAPPELAIPLYEHFIALCREKGFSVETGVFGAEMQVRSQDDFSDRLVFYSSFPIINRLQRGDNASYALTPLYMVGITDFVVPGVISNDDLINHYTIRNVKDNGIQFTDSVHYITVELPKLDRTLTEVKDTPEWILYTIKNMGKMREMPSEYCGSYLEKMFRLSNFASMDEMSQREYLARYMWEVDQRSQLRSARNEGLAEGQAKGHAEGLRETAKRMLMDGLDLSIIQRYTGLSSEEIRGL